MNNSQAINNQPQGGVASVGVVAALAAAFFVASCGGGGGFTGAEADIFLRGGPFTPPTGVDPPPDPVVPPPDPVVPPPDPVVPPPDPVVPPPDPVVPPPDPDPVTPPTGGATPPTIVLSTEIISDSSGEVKPITPAFSIADDTLDPLDNTLSSDLGVLPDEIVPEQYNRRTLQTVIQQNRDNFGGLFILHNRLAAAIPVGDGPPPQTYITIAAPYALANPATPPATTRECTPETRASRPELCADPDPNAPVVLEPSRVCAQNDYNLNPITGRGGFNPVTCDAENAGAYSGYWYERIVSTTIGPLRYDPGGTWGDVISLDDVATTDIDESSHTITGKDVTLTPQPGGERIPAPVDVPPPHPPLIPGDNPDGSPIIPPPVQRPPTTPFVPGETRDITNPDYTEKPFPENRGSITIQRCNTPIDETAIMQIAASYNCLTGAAVGLEAPDVFLYQQRFDHSPHTAVEHAFTITDSDDNVVTLKFNPNVPNGDLDENGATDEGYLSSREDAFIHARDLGYPDLNAYYRDSVVNHLFSPQAAGLDETQYDPLIILPAVPKPPEVRPPLIPPPISPAPLTPFEATDPFRVSVYDAELAEYNGALEAYNTALDEAFEVYANAVNKRQAIIDGLVDVFFPAAVKAENVLFVAPVAIFDDRGNYLQYFDRIRGQEYEYSALNGAATCGDFRLLSVLEICLGAPGIYDVNEVDRNGGSTFFNFESVPYEVGTGYQSGFSTRGEATAAAYVAGLASLVRSQWPSLTATETRDILLACAKYSYAYANVPADPVIVGAGVLNNINCLLHPRTSSLCPDDFDTTAFAINGVCDPSVTRGPAPVVANPLPRITADSASGGVLSPDSFNSDAFVFYDYFNRDFKRDVVTSSDAPAHLAPFSHPLSLVRHNNDAFSDDSAFAPAISHTFASKSCSLAVGVALESASFAGASGYGDFELGTSYTPHLAGACSFNLPNNSSVSLFASHTHSVMPSAAQQSIVSRLEGSQSVLGARITSQKGPLLLSLEARHGSGVKGSLHAFGETLAVNPKPWTHASFSLALPF